MNLHVGIVLTFPIEKWLFYHWIQVIFNLHPRFFLIFSLCFFLLSSRNRSIWYFRWYKTLFNIKSRWCVQFKWVHVALPTLFRWYVQSCSIIFGSIWCFRWYKILFNIKKLLARAIQVGAHCFIHTFSGCACRVVWWHLGQFGVLDDIKYYLILKSC
jgi:hypothetical protein